MSDALRDARSVTRVFRRALWMSVIATLAAAPTSGCTWPSHTVPTHTSTQKPPEEFKFHTPPEGCFDTLEPQLAQVMGDLYHQSRRNEIPTPETLAPGWAYWNDCGVQFHTNRSGVGVTPRSWAAVVVVLDFDMPTSRTAVTDAKERFTPVAGDLGGGSPKREDGVWDEAVSWWNSDGTAYFRARISNLVFTFLETGERYLAEPEKHDWGDSYQSVEAKDDPDPSTREKLEADVKLLATALAAQLNK